MTTATRRRLVLPLLWLLAAPAAAQSERISLTLVPAPDQTVKMESTIDLKMGADGPMVLDIAMKNRSAMTMDVGPRAADGSVTSKVTVDDAELSATMNGSPMPVPTQSLKGTTMTLQIGANGERKVVDASGAVGPEVLQQVTGMAADAIAKAGSISVGETVTVPINMPLPVPGRPGQGGVDGTMRLKLLAIEQDGGSRIGRFEQSVESGIGNTGADMPMQLKMTGTGTSTWNLTYGFQQAQDMTVNFDMTMGQAGSNAAIKGTMTMVQRGTRAPK